MENGASVVALEGDIAQVAATRMRDYLDRLTDTDGLRLVVDFSGVNYMNTAGIEVLISTMKHLRERGGAMALAQLPKPVQKVFQITRLNEIFPIFDTVEDAIASFET
jgi:anti-sigma B factor antagonist